MNGWHKLTWPNGQVCLRFFLDGVAYLSDPRELDSEARQFINTTSDPFCRGPVTQYINQAEVRPLTEIEFK